MSERETIERDGERFVLVPEKTFERMIEDLDELDDIRAYDRAKAKPQEFVPAEIVDRLIAGANPIKIWREHRGLTQQALAEAVGISTPYLSQLENGAREASIGVLRRLAVNLSVDLDDLSPADRGTDAASSTKKRAAKAPPPVRAGKRRRAPKRV